MKKLSCVLLILLVFSLTGAQEQAQPSKAVSGGIGRTAALGGNPYNPYVQDYTDVFVNPAYAAMNKNFLFGELGNSFANQYVGVGQYAAYTLGLGNMALGIAIGKREGPMFAENAYGTGGFAASDYMIAHANQFGQTLSEPMAPVQVYGAFKAGALTVGAGLYRSWWSQTDDGMNTVGAGQKGEASNTQTGIKGGVLLDLSSSVVVDAGILFRINSTSIDFKDSNPTPPVSSAEESASGTEIAVNGRVFLKFSDRLTVIPQVRFATFGYEPEYTQNPPPGAPPGKNSYGRTEFEAGVGVNSKFDGGWVAVGVAAQSISLSNDVTPSGGQTTKNTMSWFDLPKVNVGAEFDFLPWLKGRVGYFKRLSSMTNTIEPPSPGVKTETSNSVEPGYTPSLGYTGAQQQVSLGLGILLNRVSIDGYVGERVLAAGTWILSGRTQDLFGVLSMSVNFD